MTHAHVKSLGRAPILFIGSTPPTAARSLYRTYQRAEEYSSMEQPLRLLLVILLIALLGIAVCI
jgi:hypothetical protein